MAKTLFRYNTRDLGQKIQQQLQSMPGKCKRAMDAVGGYLNGETKDRTPVDEGTLTADISNRTEQYKKSYAAVVYVPSNAPSAPYAVPMHEGRYNLGKNSLIKQSKTGKNVGRKYMTNALFDNRDKIKRIILREVRIK